MKFIRFSALELAGSGIAAAAVSGLNGFETLSALCAVLGLAGAALFFAARYLQPLMAAVAASRPGKWIGFLPILLVTLFLFTYRPGSLLLTALSPILFAGWLIGLQYLWAFHGAESRKHDHKEPPKLTSLSFVGLTLAALFLLLPSRIPSLLGGIPIDQPLEFIVAALALPLVWFIHPAFFAKRNILIGLLVITVIRAILFASLPQSGLSLRAHRSEANTPAAGYQTWLANGYTEIMQQGYTSIRELPVEWVNDRLAADVEQVWVSIEAQGVIRLRDEGRPVFVIRGAKDVHAPAGIMVIADRRELTGALYEQINTEDGVQVSIQALYTKFGEARFEPLLLYPDGSYKSLFDHADVWVSQEISFSKEQAAALRRLQNGLAMLFMAGLVLGGAQGWAGLAGQNQVSEADLYLLLSSPAVFFAASSVGKPDIPVVMLVMLAILAVIKITDMRRRALHPNFGAMLLFAGMPFLLGMLAFDLDTLRAIASLPAAQDGLEYQTFARNIFVNGDIFLAETPPRAYKVLFPYLVGLLHVVFGQSSAAQFFLNAWCAMLSAGLIFALAIRLHLPFGTSLSTGLSFVFILCLPSSFIYYFRFGLIEPAAVLCLLLTIFFAHEHRRMEMTLAAIATLLLRLDYLGIVLASCLLWSNPVAGNFSSAWSSLWAWGRRSLRPMWTYALTVTALPTAVIAAYYVFTPGYILSAGDVSQSSLLSMLDGFMRVLLGGNFNDFKEKSAQGSFEFLLIVLPLALGFAVSMLSIFHRRGIFAKIDLRLALLVPAILPAYIAVRPAAYFPRFSFPLLALDLLLSALLLHGLFNKSRVVSGT